MSHVLLIMPSFPVLIADHSQAKYFSKYLSLPSIDVISYSGFRICQMFEKIQPTITNYNTVVLHVGANDLACGTPVKKMLQLFQALASGIWELNPTVDILLSGLLPRTDNQFPGVLQHTDFIADVNQRAYQLNNCLASLEYHSFTMSVTQRSPRMVPSRETFSVEMVCTSGSEERLQL